MKQSPTSPSVVKSYTTSYLSAKPSMLSYTSYQLKNIGGKFSIIPAATLSSKQPLSLHPVPSRNLKSPTDIDCSQCLQMVQTAPAFKTIDDFSTHALKNLAKKISVSVTDDEQVNIDNIYVMISLFITTLKVIGLDTQILSILFGPSGSIIDLVYKCFFTINCINTNTNTNEVQDTFDLNFPTIAFSNVNFNGRAGGAPDDEEITHIDVIALLTKNLTNSKKSFTKDVHNDLLEKLNHFINFCDQN